MAYPPVALAYAAVAAILVVGVVGAAGSAWGSAEGGRAEARDTTGLTGVPAELAARFLVPESFHAEPGRNLRVQLVEDAGEGPARIVPWEECPVQWFFIRTGGTQDNFDEVPLEPAGRGGGGAGGGGEDALLNQAAIVRIPMASVAVVGVDLRARIVEVTAAELAAASGAGGRASLEGEPPSHQPRLHGPRHGDDTLRIRRIESATMIIRAGKEGFELARSVATAKTGQNVEIRLLMDPVGAVVGGDIPVRAYVNGDGHEGRLFATAVNSGRVQEFTTDERGIGIFALSEPGEWRLELHHLAPADDDPEDGRPDAAWVLYTATVTFQARAAPPPRPPSPPAPPGRPALPGSPAPDTPAQREGGAR